MSIYRTGEQDTIAAIATGLTESGIGIIRISGPESFAIAKRVFRTGGGKTPELAVPNRVQHGFILLDPCETNNVSRETCDRRLQDAAKRNDLPEMLHPTHLPDLADHRNLPDIQDNLHPSDTLDEVLMINMHAPHSYTGEDTIEIDCHGGVLMMQRILETVIRAGARLAEPGEFTKRAFLNGRIDLAQAEAVIDIINARNDRAIRASVSQLKGSMSQKISKLRSGLLHDAAEIESALDDPEHYSLDAFDEEFRTRTEAALQEVEELIASFHQGKLIREGINTVILGKPNAGKSSLLNTILGEERAIVTQIPGTTRDTIMESVSIGSLTLNLMDTAGIRKTEDLVEQIGVQKALDQAAKADLVLCVIDASHALEEADYELLELVREQDVKTLFLLNKSDLAAVVRADEILESMPEEKRDVLSISALTGSGIPALTGRIREMFALGEISYNDELIVSNLRHVKLLEKTRDALYGVLGSIDAGMSQDFYTVDLMDAYTVLGMIIGEAVGDDLVNEIFSDFCMGK